MRAQHLFGPQLLPRPQPAPWSGCEFWRAAMPLQSVSAQHHRNLVERQPIERLAVAEQG